MGPIVMLSLSCVLCEMEFPESSERVRSCENRRQVAAVPSQTELNDALQRPSRSTPRPMTQLAGPTLESPDVAGLTSKNRPLGRRHSDATAVIVVHVEQLNRPHADRSQTDDQVTTTQEML